MDLEKGPALFGRLARRCLHLLPVLCFHGPKLWHSFPTLPMSQCLNSSQGQGFRKGAWVIFYFHCCFSAKMKLVSKVQISVLGVYMHYHLSLEKT